MVRFVRGDMTVVWLGMVAAGVLATPLALWMLHNDGNSWSWSAKALLCVAGTGVVHAIYIRLLSRSYERGDISVVYPVARGCGVGLTALIGFFLLDEPSPPLGSLGVLLVVAGVLMLGMPFYQAASKSGFGFAVATGLAISGYTIIDKIGVAVVHPLVFIWLMYLIMAILLIPHFRGRWGIMSGDWPQRRLALVVGPCSLFTYTIILYAYRIGPVSYVAAVRESAVIVGAALGIWFLGERLSLSKGLAIGAIALGLVCIRFM